MGLSVEAELLIIKYLRKWVIAMAALITAITSFSGYSVYKLAEETASHTAKSQVESTLEFLHKELESLRTQRLEVAKEIGKADMTNILLTARQEELEALIDKTTADIKELKSKKANAESVLSTLTGLNTATSELATKIAKDPSLIGKLKDQLQPLPVGTVVPYSGEGDSLQPNGDWLICDGRELKVQDFKELWDVIGFAHGGDDRQEYFNIPDLRGRFIRGVDHEQGRDPDASLRSAGNSRGNSGDRVGSIQGDATKIPNSGFAADSNGDHVHKDPTWNASSGQFELATVHRGPGGYDYGRESAPTAPSGEHRHRISGGDLETRPKNISLNFLIKVR